MKKLLEGVVAFRQQVRPGLVDKFKELENQQAPDTLLIACSDSRVVPNLFASTNPGDVFVVRNVGNLVPAYSDPSLGMDLQTNSEYAAIEFSLNALPIKDIVVCGHSNCGAMHAVLTDSCSSLPALYSWLQNAVSTKKKLKDSETYLTHSPEKEVDTLSQLNVLQQIEHLKSHPVISKRFEEGTVNIHGWWFDVGHADVYQYDTGMKKFMLIDKL